MQRDVFTAQEIRSLLFYQGAVENIVLSPDEIYLKKFYSISSAYEAINMLLFDDIGSEQVRLYTEQRYIDSTLLDYMPELLNVYCGLYSAICKYTYQNDRREAVYTYRDDRGYTCERMKKLLQNESFISSTLDSKKSESAFRYKDQLTFFEFIADVDVEFLDMNKVLGTLSKYPKEKEILFPPFLKLCLENMEMTEEDKRLKGINDTPPVGKYQITFGKSLIIPEPVNEKVEKDLTELRNAVLEPSAIENAKQVWEEISKNQVNSARCEKYMEWKKLLQEYLKKCYSGIKWNIQNDSSRERIFLKDIDSKVAAMNEKREQYERILYTLYKIEIGLGCLAGLFLSLSMLDIWTQAFKVLFLIVLTGLAGIAGGCKISSLPEKLVQRTECFLRYDELRQRWKYEKLHDSETLDLYIDRMLEIMVLDNQLCKQYTDNKIKNMKEWEAKMKKIKETEY